MRNSSLAFFFLRLGIATVFLYAAIASFLDPLSWVGFFPVWLKTLFPATILLYLFSTYEIVLAFWLLSGRHALYAASLAALTLFSIVIFNTSALDIVFRDVAILFAAVALASLTHEQQKKGKK